MTSSKKCITKKLPESIKMRVRYHGGKLKSCFDGKEVTKFKQNSIGKTLAARTSFI